MLTSAQLPLMLGICSNDNDTGAVSLGGADSSLYNGSLVYTPIVPVAGRYLAYFVGFVDLVLDGKSLQSPVEPIPYGLVDSGTTLLILPFFLYANFMDELRLRHGTAAAWFASPNQCVAVSDAQFASLPVIHVVLAGVTISIGGRQYMRACPTSHTPGLYIPGIVQGVCVAVDSGPKRACSCLLVCC
jgi:hypothetical protein